MLILFYSGLTLVLAAVTPRHQMFQIMIGPGAVCAQAYTPALLMPASCFLAAWGAVYGPHWVDQLLAFVTSFDVNGCGCCRSCWAGACCNACIAGRVGCNMSCEHERIVKSCLANFL